MPSGRPYMKSEQEVVPAGMRAEMTRLAIRDVPYFRFSPLEVEQTGNTYTYRTLERLRRENPDTAYYFIVGADTLFQMPSWVKPERVFAVCTVVAAVRNDKTPSDMEEQLSLLRRRYNAQITLLHTARTDISSTEVRRKAAAGISIADDVPEAVRAYIEERGLYR